VVRSGATSSDGGVRVRVMVLFWVTSKPKNSSCLTKTQYSLTKYIDILYIITEQVRVRALSWVTVKLKNWIKIS
jgi:hypothetical protein